MESSEEVCSSVTKHSISRRDFLRDGVILGTGAIVGAALPGRPLEAQAQAAVSTDEVKQHFYSPVSLEDIPGTEHIPPIGPPQKWDQEADIVVVGVGGGGIGASVYCADHGASVIAIDKVSLPGGVTQESSVFAVFGGTRVQNDLKWALPTFPFNPEALARMWVAQAPGADLEMARTIAVKTPECADWMQDHGVKWSTDPQFGYVALCWEGSCDGDFYPRATKLVTDHMYDIAKDKGVKFLFDTECKTLVKDGNQIVGIQTKTIKGETIHIRAKKAVILTSGGCAANPAMLQKYCPTGYAASASCYIPPSDTGEVIRMGFGAGADLDGFDTFMAFDGGIDDYAQGTGPFAHYLYSGDNQLSRQPWLSIDIMGNRYAYYDSDPSLSPKQDPTPIMAMTRQAEVEIARIGYRGYVIFDADYETNIFKLRQAACRRPITPDMQNVDRMPEWMAPHDWKVGVQRALDRGGIKKSDTIAGLAKELGFDPAVLEKAVKDWNGTCAAGVDPKFGYKPYWLNPIAKAPFYGIRIGAQMQNTGVGLRVNTKMQVIDTKGKVIRGLYAGGQTAGGLITFVSCNAASWTCGYIAAENAVKEEV